MPLVPAAWLRTLARKTDRLSAWLWRRALGLERRDLRAYGERWSATLREWLLYHQRDVVFRQCRWMGVPALKNPLDAWIYQELLHRIRPDVLVEIGSSAGGSTLFFAHLFDLLDHGTVISVDVDRSRFEPQHPRIRPVTGDSGDPAVVEQVAEACRGRSVMVVHDGDHTAGAVLRDLRAYADLVSVGSYLVVEDGLVDLFPPTNKMGSMAEGPLVAVERFLAEDDRFRVDNDCERYVLTYNPCGFLKRI